MALTRRTPTGPWQYEFEYNGERLRGSTGTRDYATAQKVEKQARADAHAQAKLGKLPPRTIAQACHDYYTGHVVPKSVNNVDPRNRPAQSHLGLVVGYFGEDRQISTIDPAAVEKYKAHLVGAETDGGAGLAPGGADRQLQVLRAVLRYSMGLGYLREVKPFKLFNVNSGHVRYLSDEEEARLLPACNDELRDVVTFLMDVGCRLADALKLTWRRIQWGDVPQVSIEMDKASKKKGDLPRSVPLTPRVQELLRRRWAASSKNLDERTFAYDARTHQTSNGRKGQRGGCVRRCDPSRGKFHGVGADPNRPGKFYAWIVLKNGTKRHLDTFPSQMEAAKARITAEVEIYGPPTDVSLDRAWDLAIEASSVEDFTIHDLRHTFGSRLAIAGVHIRTIQTLMGHSDVTMTEKYTHLAPAQTAEAMAALARRAPTPSADRGTTAPASLPTSMPKPVALPVLA